MADSRGLQTLAELGIAVDHGVVKRDYFFISDFSKKEIKQIREAGFEVEILIADVKAYYVNQNLNPDPNSPATEKNANGSISSFRITSFFLVTETINCNDNFV